MSIYGRDKRALSSILPAHPALAVRQKTKDGLHSLHFSSKDRISSDKARDHVDALARELPDLPAVLIAIAEGGGPTLEVRLWLFQECGQGNHAFVLSEPAIAWLAAMKADVCVDIWAVG